MISFAIAGIILISGYYTYGKWVENVFGIDTKGGRSCDYVTM
ncbi:hypothetical protein [Pseudozobellia thermophila]|uniref:CstA N-terminal domain-containing protein n=1 Tax=Pseudozobellia thermophila TaxID=192903 RepID=A0A1M6G4L8_9FLAO|nr:hypothetical protein [Pseudozobellia thermophila]SHJ04926.1 hypothetical protein SAMN04488513_102676 [Pseudozobellia thermophila]